MNDTSKNISALPQLSMNRKERRKQERKNKKIAKLLAKGAELVADFKKQQVEDFRQVFLNNGLDPDGEHKELFQQAIDTYLK